jgi:diaminohydroxyphosphoribosylaminopyrimidine deaminase/5-amino-6-(5-phosphoribosylamino)uracil reductase
MAEEIDRRFLAAAIRLGAGALGTSWPNPAVGAILVKDGRVLGRGRTAAAHYGRAGPCADAIVAAGVARVVAPSADPDPRVAGQGFARLRAAGVELTTGLLAEEAGRAHAGHLRQVADKRPHVTLKLAVSADDAIGRVAERQVAVTRAIARRHVQALRSRYDAILVGSGTVLADDPQLTCRLPGLEGRSPVRVVLDSGGRVGDDRQVFSGDTPTWVLTAAGKEHANGPRRRLLVPRSGEGLDLAACLTRLSAEGITRLMVEGGARVARSFLEADLVDEALIFRSRTALGGDIVPALGGLPLSALERSSRFHCIERRRFGPDVMSRYARAG